MLWSAPFAHIGEWVPNEPLVRIDQFFSVPLTHYCLARRLIFQSRKRLRWFLPFSRKGRLRIVLSSRNPHCCCGITLATASPHRHQKHGRLGTGAQLTLGA